MIKAKFGDQLDAWLLRVLPFLKHWPLPANLCTVIGTAISVGGAVAFAFGAFVTGAILLLAGGFFDLTDGVIARQRGTASDFGAFLDSTLDRLVDMTLLVGLMIFYARGYEPGLVLLAGSALIVSVMTSYAKARVEEFVPVPSGGLIERGERIGLIALGAVTGWMVVALWVIVIFGSYTVGQRFLIAYRALSHQNPAASSGIGDSG